MTKATTRTKADDVLGALRAVIYQLTPQPATDDERRLWSWVQLLDFYRQFDADRTRESVEREIYSKTGVNLAGDATWRRLTEPAAVSARRVARRRCDRAVSRILEATNRNDEVRR